MEKSETVARLPIDSTVLSQIIYEGYLVYKRHGSFKKAFKELRKELPENVQFNLVGNDMTIMKRKGLRKGFPETLLMKLDPDKISEKVIEKRAKEGRTYKNLFDPNFLEELVNSKLIDEDIIRVSEDDLKFTLSRGEALIGGQKDIASLQILKIDRYTGFTSLESGLTSRQITMYLSINVALLLILGLLSSLVIKRGNSLYLLFFSPIEVQKLFLESGSVVVENYFIIKNKFKKVLNEVLSKVSHGELILLELQINAGIYKTMKEKNQDFISLNLIKIDREGQTYKIYEHIPIDHYKEPLFLNSIKSFIKNEEKFLEELMEILDPKGDIVSAIGSIGTKKSYIEADNALRAVMSLYRFIFLGDPQGLFQFCRELANCYTKLKAGTRTETKRAAQYQWALSRLSKT